jgi:hypothetical protein
MSTPPAGTTQKRFFRAMIIWRHCPFPQAKNRVLDHYVIE